MKSAVLAVSLLAAASGTASAGTYLGLGIGTAPAVSEDTDRLASDGRSGKLILGNKFSRLAVEGSLTKYAMTRDDSRGVPKAFGDLYQAAIALKLNFPLGNNFEAFGRGGLHHTWLSTQTAANDTDGSGFLLGGGVEYKLDLGIGGGSLFLDYTVSTAKLTGDKVALESSMTSRVFMLGVTVGL